MTTSQTPQDDREQDPDYLSDRIYAAAEEGDETELRMRLAQWKHRGFEQEIIENSLICAVSANQAVSVRLLMEYGLKFAGCIPAVAVDCGVSTDVWQALLDGGFDPNSHDIARRPVILIVLARQLRYPSSFLSEAFQEPMLVWFLSHGASVEAFSTRDGLTAISWTAGYRPVSVLRALLKHSGYDQVESLNRSNAVHEAAGNKREDRTAALALLVDELGADVNILSTYKTYGKPPPRYNRPECRPLHKAVLSGRREHVRFLLDRGARITEKDADGKDVAKYARGHFSEGWQAVEEWYAEKGLKITEEAKDADNPSTDAQK